jgi:hypothetical protein
MQQYKKPGLILACCLNHLEEFVSSLDELKSADEHERYVNDFLQDEGFRILGELFQYDYLFNRIEESDLTTESMQIIDDYDDTYAESRKTKLKD